MPSKQQQGPSITNWHTLWLLFMTLHVERI
uniref:Uncharacterized protein n=1 Tax=Arundo donax TaxID=35708 RepID=A0A0A8Y7R5_ARUDO